MDRSSYTSPIIYSTAQHSTAQYKPHDNNDTSPRPATAEKKKKSFQSLPLHLRNQLNKNPMSYHHHDQGPTCTLKSGSSFISRLVGTGSKKERKREAGRQASKHNPIVLEGIASRHPIEIFYLLFTRVLGNTASFQQLPRIFRIIRRVATTQPESLNHEVCM
jgi:hypothetical protein